MPGGLHPPISVILTWIPNYIDPETRGPVVPILVLILLTLCYFVVMLRLYTRIWLSKNFGWDDALIIFNMIPLTGEAVCLYLAFTRYGFNHHVWDNRIPVLVQSRKITVALEATYLLSTSCTKISILLFYRRLGMGTVTNRFRYSVYAAITFVVAYYIVFTVNLYVGCRPFNAFWNQANLAWVATHEGEWSCFEEASNLIAAAVISVLQDFIACFMPMVLFWKLRIRLKQKIALATIFGVGFFLCICGILRVSSTTRIYYETYDMTWESQDAWIWFAVESHMAVVCASAPALNYFFKHAHNGSSIGSYLQDTARRVGAGYSRTKDKENSSNGTTTIRTIGGGGRRGSTIDKSQFTQTTTSGMDGDGDATHELELMEKGHFDTAQPPRRSTGHQPSPHDDGFGVSWLNLGQISEIETSDSETSLFRDVEAAPGLRRPPAVYTARSSGDYPEPHGL